MTEAEKVAIHELAPVVRMEGDDLPRVPAETRLKGSDHMHFCLCPYRSCLGPSRTPIRDRESPVEVSHCLPSIMTHQVHGQGARDIQEKHPSDWTKVLGGRVHARLNGNPASQGSAPGMRDAMQDISLPLSSKESPNGGRTHLQEESSGLLINGQMPMVHEVLHEEGHACCQTDRAQEGAGTPDGDECLQDGRTIPGRTVSPLSMFVQCEGCTWICLPGSATRTQSPRRYRPPAWCRTRAAYLRQYPVD